MWIPPLFTPHSPHVEAIALAHTHLAVFHGHLRNLTHIEGVISTLNGCSVNRTDHICLIALIGPLNKSETFVSITSNYGSEPYIEGQ
jgi:hypothetical protein